MILIILLIVILYGLTFIRLNPMVKYHSISILEGNLRIRDRHDVRFLFFKFICTFVYVGMNTTEAKFVFYWFLLFLYEIVIFLIINEFSSIAKIDNKDLVSLLAETY